MGRLNLILWTLAIFDNFLSWLIFKCLYIIYFCITLYYYFILYNYIIYYYIIYYIIIKKCPRIFSFALHICNTARSSYHCAQGNQYWASPEIAISLPFPTHTHSIMSTISVWLYKHKTHSYKHQRSRWTESWAVITTSVVVVVAVHQTGLSVCVCVREQKCVWVSICFRLWQAKFLQHCKGNSTWSSSFHMQADCIERERERGRKRNAGNGGVAVGALVDSAYILWLWVQEQE